MNRNDDNVVDSDNDRNEEDDSICYETAGGNESKYIAWLVWQWIWWGNEDKFK